jgi:hypothetical protein
MTFKFDFKIFRVFLLLILWSMAYQNTALAEGKQCRHLFGRAKYIDIQEPSETLTPQELATLEVAVENYVKASEELNHEALNPVKLEKMKSALLQLESLKKGLAEIIKPFRELKYLTKKHKDEMHQILLKILVNPEYEFTPHEQLKINNNLEVWLDFQKARAFARKHQKIASAYSNLIKAKKFVFWSMLVGSITFKSLILHGDMAPQDLAQVPLAPNQIEVAYLSPLPHAQIQIGQQVYNYGPGIILKTTAEREYESDDNGLYRNSVRVRLNLSEDERANLQKYLEGEVGKHYAWIPNGWAPTAFMCVSATHRALEQTTDFVVPAGVDRSPILSEAYFSSLYVLGDPRIEGIYYVKRGNYLEVTLEALVSSADGFYSSTWFWINAGIAQVDDLPNSF